ncbi:MAG: PDZ domain-containing protein [Candidatus Omnitrophica bacterium]|nr:PDZ domain-containing protein [Candidatus Omnitrophota bacterium]MDE2010094.1 PDZ domain-containing protein [Candidatus Omnitrophota bacterium]MDE2214920.1 PDZ domain-containing protein [Candidatus Omnitrophota bacterium]MDE2232275.1 PDZ domain-containing protein [Candidatus Omnitrophota bacterium]
MCSRIICIFLMAASLGAVSSPVLAAAPAAFSGRAYKQYTAFFEKVYKTFQENYYLAPDRKIYDHFLKEFNTIIYPQLKGEGKSIDYVRWRSAWYLADALRSRDDKFTQFYPPKPAVKFKREALGEKIDLGIIGQKNDTGFLVTRMEPRSDAYEKGLRENDVILQINGRAVARMTQEEIEKELTPLVNTRVRLTYLSHETATRKTIVAVSKKYFKQTVFLHPVPVPGVFCLEVPKFNRMTGQDMYRFLSWIEEQRPKGLVLDLRGNPGGPPLAAREISAFFLKGGQEFAYFQERNGPKADLDVPDIGAQYQFDGPIVILVDADTGSAAELFTGIMQFRKRAVVLGVNTAGQILLKRMFPMGDGSMLALVVARGYYPDGQVFGFDGITPNKIITGAPKDGLINLAAAYIEMQTQQQ